MEGLKAKDGAFWAAVEQEAIVIASVNDWSVVLCCVFNVNFLLFILYIFTVFTPKLLC
jgi:hypothetical protein